MNVLPRAEPKALTPDRIIELARRPYGFRVSWRYRDEKLMRRCFALVKQGRLRRIHRKVNGEHRFAAVRVPACQPTDGVEDRPNPPAPVLEDLFA